MNDLRDYRWENRLILVQAAPETEDAVDVLRDARLEVDDRDIIWFVNTGAGLVSNQVTPEQSKTAQVAAVCAAIDYALST